MILPRLVPDGSLEAIIHCRAVNYTDATGGTYSYSSSSLSPSLVGFFSFIITHISNCYFRGCAWRNFARTRFRRATALLQHDDNNKKNY